jgi:hypothetical protein
MRRITGFKITVMNDHFFKTYHCRPIDLYVNVNIDHFRKTVYYNHEACTEPRRSEFERPTTACFTVPYATSVGAGINPAIEAVFTIWPKPCLTIRE